MLYYLLIGLALAERLWFDLGPNIELVTTASILAGTYGKGWQRFGVPLVIMAVSDLFLGFGAIALFTWSGFLLAGVWPRLWQRGGVTRPWAAISGGLTSALWFYAWTNFGVWLTDSFSMYPKTAAGLLQCMVNGLPFLRLNLYSTLILVPMGVLMAEMLVYFKQNKEKRTQIVQAG